MGRLTVFLIEVVIRLIVSIAPFTCIALYFLKYLITIYCNLGFITIYGNLVLLQIFYNFS